MYNLKELKYNDLKSILCHNHTLNGIIVDDASLEVMLRIEKTMQRLKVIGFDAKRILWIEIKAPGKRNRFEETDANDNYWYQMCSAHIKDFHYMQISNREGKFIYMQSSENIFNERVADEYYEALSEPLKKIEKYISALVDHICENPDEYNNYVEKNLPYSKRDGRIRRADLNRICPIYRTFDNPQYVVDIVCKYKSLSLTTYKTMTLRTYMHVWRIAYEAYRTKDKGLPDKKYQFEGLTDEEIFRRYNNKGREIEGLDLDSEEDYLKWYTNNRFFHCLDVAYARIHLLPFNNDLFRSLENTDSSSYWRIDLRYSVYGYTNDYFNILESFCEKGIRVNCDDEMKRLIGYAKETGYVDITPSPNYHFDEISLPCVDDGITTQQINDIIAATKWKKQQKVRPIIKKNSKKK
ncbi:MAG: hypothetical protein VZR53_17200 [Prevotella sp.]|nr:hypothetical protein [Prevotella sp.]